MNSATVLRSFKLPDDTIPRFLVASPDGTKIVLVSIRDNITLWDTKSTLESRPVQTMDASVTISCVSFSPDGKSLAIGSYEGIIVLYDIEADTSLQSLESPHGTVTSVVFLPDGARLASGASDRVVTIWELQSGTALQTLTGHTGGVQSMAVSPDGRHIASGSFDGTVRLWDTDLGLSSKAPRGHNETVDLIKLSPDGRFLVSSSVDIIKLWDVKSGALLRTLEPQNRLMGNIAFSPDSDQIASGTINGTFLWDINSGIRLRVFQGSHGPVHVCIAFSPDGTQIVTADGNVVELWDIASGKLLKEFKPDDFENLEAAFVAFSPDGRLALAPAIRFIAIHEFESHASRRILHNNVIVSMAFSPDGEHLALSCSNKTIRFYGVESGEVVQTIDSGVLVNWLYFSTDGTHLTTDCGVVYLNTSSFKRDQARKWPNLLIKDQWIMADTQKLLWLPPQFRGKSSTVHWENVYLGDSTGNVRLLQFDFSSMPFLE